MKTPSSRRPTRPPRQRDDFCIRSVGDSALAIVFEERIDPMINARVAAVTARLDALRLNAVLDVVPTYRSVTVYYDPLMVTDTSLKARLAQILNHHPRSHRTRTRIVDIPVCYDEEFGIDLRSIGDIAGLTRSRIVELHTSRVYRVYMLGFLPGFPYMAEVPAALAMPRLTTPRRSVPAGSVGIADAQTGIYPMESPGGWRIIGRTPMQIYDPGRRRPFLLAAGDRVRFRPIDRKQFDQLCHERIHLQT